MAVKITAYKQIPLLRIYPLLWGVLMYNVLRAVTDLSHNSPFWYGSTLVHISSLLVSVASCYLYNYVWQRRLRRSGGVHAFIKEYRYTLAELFLSLNLLLLTGQKTGLLTMGAGWIDYVLINATYIPLLLILYTLIRNNIISRNIHDEMLAMEMLKVQKKEAELNFLKAQYHPHFLFNALNTVYFQIEETNAEARQTVEQLAALLRYQLYDINGYVVFSKEMEHLQLYIAFEKKRKTDKLLVSVEADPALYPLQVPPLLFQPLIENAFKYVAGSYQIVVAITLSGNEVVYIVKNTVTETGMPAQGTSHGIGLDNLKRRLDLLYPGRHTLNTEKAGNYFTATLTFKLN